MSDKSGRSERCRCGAVVLESFIGTYSMAQNDGTSIDHTRELCSRAMNPERFDPLLAARIEGARLALEAAAKECDDVSNKHDLPYCDDDADMCAERIRALSPESIVKGGSDATA